MDDPIFIDEPPLFNAEEWIGKNKKYSTAPYFVRDACTREQDCTGVRGLGSGHVLHF